MRGWKGDAHLGDAHLGPELKAYEPDRWLMGVQAQALALMSQFSSDKDSFWAAADCMSEISLNALRDI